MFTQTLTTHSKKVRLQKRVDYNNLHRDAWLNREKWQENILAQTSEVGWGDGGGVIKTKKEYSKGELVQVPELCQHLLT